MRMTNKRREQLEKLALLRFHRKTFEECAKELEVSLRTVKAWAATPEYRKVCGELTGNWRDQAQGRIAELGDEVISKLCELMHHARSDFVKFHAAKTLGDWLRLGQEDHVEEAQDDRAELMALSKLLLDRAAQQPQVPTNFRVLPGGLLPTVPALEVVEGEVVEEPKP